MFVLYGAYYMIFFILFIVIYIVILWYILYSVLFYVVLILCFILYYPLLCSYIMFVMRIQLPMYGTQPSDLDGCVQLNKRLLTEMERLQAKSQ